MKRYIIETDEQRIFSYKVKDEGAGVACILMRPHGNTSYAMEDMEAYWNWFRDEISLLPEEEIDLCFLYPQAAQKEFAAFFQQKPSFCYPKATAWNVTEVEKFFHEHRERTLHDTIRYDAADGRLLFSSGKVFFARGLDDGGLRVAVKAVHRKHSPAAPKRTSAVKVYMPPSTPSAQIRDWGENDPKPKVSRAEMMPKEAAASLPVEKVTGEDMQRFIEEQVKGQCDTVAYRSGLAHRRSD